MNIQHAGGLGEYADGLAVSLVITARKPVCRLQFPRVCQAEDARWLPRAPERAG